MQKVALLLHCAPCGSKASMRGAEPVSIIKLPVRQQAGLPDGLGGVPRGPQDLVLAPGHAPYAHLRRHSEMVPTWTGTLQAAAAHAIAMLSGATAASRRGTRHASACL